MAGSANSANGYDADATKSIPRGMPTRQQELGVADNVPLALFAP
jgi:hypothetical protein